MASSIWKPSVDIAAADLLHRGAVGRRLLPGNLREPGGSKARLAFQEPEGVPSLHAGELLVVADQNESGVLLLGEACDRGELGRAGLTGLVDEAGPCYG